MPLFTSLAAGVLDLLAPEFCALCGAARDGRPWCEGGPRVAGLRPWDASHLCLACAGRLGAAAVVIADQCPATADGPARPAVWAARATAADLVAVVGAWKYHGLRGLAWPLARLAAAAAAAAARDVAGPALLVAVPLHRRRQRGRGFNQSAVLAGLLGRQLGWPAPPGILARRRATLQQARLAEDTARVRNLEGSCRARSPGPEHDVRSVVLVDDIVTSGATVAEAARALAAAGWRPRGVLALGVRSLPAG